MTWAVGAREREVAFRAYAARQGAVLWRRALLLTAGDRVVAEELLGAVLATTYAGWRDDADDSVETLLATRAMARAAANATGQSAATVADPDVLTDLQLDEEAWDTRRRIRGLDPSARAALVAAALDRMADPRSLAVALGRRPRTVRADLARGRAAWPEVATLDLIAGCLTGLEDRLDVAPSGGLVEAAMAGEGVGAERAGRPRWSRWMRWPLGLVGLPGRRGSRSPGRASASRGPRAAVGLVAAVALVGALAVAYQLSISAPAPTPTIAPQVATASPPLRAPPVYDDLPQGPAARPPAYVARDDAGRLAYVDSAGRVPLPGAASAQVHAVTPRGAFVAVADAPEGPGHTQSLVLVRPNRTTTVLVTGLIDAFPSPTGAYVAYLQLDPTPPVAATPRVVDDRPVLRLLRVDDGQAVGEARWNLSGVGWLGEGLVVLDEALVRLWRPGGPWRSWEVPRDYRGLLPVAGGALVRVSGGAIGPDCLRRWNPDRGPDPSDHWCAEIDMTPWSASPTGRYALVLLAGRTPAAVGLSWGALDVATGGHQMLGLPSGSFVLGVGADRQAWEDAEHVLFVGTDRDGGEVGIRCEVTTGRCEKAALPPDIVTRS